MYGVIGEKVLRCEIKNKGEMSSLCKIGASKKEQSISNNRLFQTDEEARAFIKKRKTNKVNENKLVANAVEKCAALYEKLYEETGIEVRTIDRQWTITAAEKHITKLIRTLSDKPETHNKNVSKSFYIAPDKKRTHKKSESKDNKSFNSKAEKKFVPSKNFSSKKGK